MSKTKPKPKPNPALDALKQTYTVAPPSIAPTDANFKLFQKFTESMEEIASDGGFTSVNVLEWYRTYIELVPETPHLSIFNNAYALGRFMKSHQESLSIELMGTYGNRHVYVLANNTNNTNKEIDNGKIKAE